MATPSPLHRASLPAAFTQPSSSSSSSSSACASLSPSILSAAALAAAEASASAVLAPTSRAPSPLPRSPPSPVPSTPPDTPLIQSAAVAAATLDPIKLPLPPVVDVFNYMKPPTLLVRESLHPVSGKVQRRLALGSEQSAAQRRYLAQVHRCGVTLSLGRAVPPEVRRQWLGCRTVLRESEMMPRTAFLTPNVDVYRMKRRDINGTNALTEREFLRMMKKVGGVDPEDPRFVLHRCNAWKPAAPLIKRDERVNVLRSRTSQCRFKLRGKMVLAHRVLAAHALGLPDDADLLDCDCYCGRSSESGLSHKRRTYRNCCRPIVVHLCREIVGEDSLHGTCANPLHLAVGTIRSKLKATASCSAERFGPPAVVRVKPAYAKPIETRPVQAPRRKNRSKRKRRESPPPCVWPDYSDATQYERVEKKMRLPELEPKPKSSGADAAAAAAAAASFALASSAEPAEQAKPQAEPPQQEPSQQQPPARPRSPLPHPHMPLLADLMCTPCMTENMMDVYNIG